MNGVVSQYLQNNEEAILAEVGATITKRALALLDEGITHTVTMVEDWFDETGNKIKHDMLDPAFREHVRKAIRGEVLPGDAKPTAQMYGDGQIKKAIAEYQKRLDAV